MTEAPQPPDRTEDRTGAMLDRLAALDLAAAEHVHARLLEADEPKAVAELARAYQRCSRAVRQVLMLMLKHEADLAARAMVRVSELSRLASTDARSRMADIRAEELKHAVGRVAAAAWPGKPRLQRDALDRLDVLIDDWLLDEDGEGEKLFLDSLDDLVLDACEELGLPAALARRWEDLPDPPQTFDPAEADLAGEPPRPVPAVDTG
jgi:hypothetical protein